MTGTVEERLVGRDDALARLRSELDRAAAGVRTVVLVEGEAGIGKTALVRAAVRAADLVGWGTCVDHAGAPGYWPWSRALDDLAAAVGRDEARALAGDDAGLLATIAGVFGESRAAEPSARDRLLLMDAVARWLDRVAATRPAVVVLDDLHWADDSSLALLEFVARSPRGAGLCLVGCYRRAELGGARRERLAGLTATHVELGGLGREAVAELVAAAGAALDAAAVDALYRRTGGHPVFSRELALLAGGDGGVPGAVRDAIDRRVRLLPAPTQRALEVAALAGNAVHPDVVAAVLSVPAATAEAALAAAYDAGVLVRDGGGRFAHDLYRETLAGRVAAAERPALHRAIGGALEARLDRGGDVSPGDLARHFAAAVPADGTSRAARWALAAARRERQSLAFTEAVAHLRRWRAAVADAAATPGDDELLDVLLAEADALNRAGSSVDARGVLRMARDAAVRAGSPHRVVDVALAVADLGAAFAARRDEVVRDLEHALSLVAGLDPLREAQVTAALARELQHSVAEDRPRAGPLSERALAFARTAGDAGTLLSCLLARHDVLWTPGSATERVELCSELVAVAQRAGDDERHAQALLLLANALLESGSAAFQAALGSCLDLLDGLGQPRHRYVAATRRAALALLRGEPAGAEAAIEDAAGLGRHIREPDTENVRMSQRLELVRARGDAAELAEFAAAAVAHWTGAPVHAHSVAAGFLARAGDLPGARRHVATVLDLGTWRADRSYLWSVFVRELAVAAVALRDGALCAQLLADVAPLAATCGVNGAVVAFAGSHAHTAGLLTNALGRDGAPLLAQAGAAYDRLGAAGWAAEVRAAAGAGRPGPSLRRTGRTWEVEYDGARATVPDSKGIGDLAVLLARPGEDVHVLDLYGSPDRSGAAGEVTDAAALAAYRTRLADLDADIAEAEAANDPERRARAADERAALVAELARASRRGGGGRVFANYPAERARKAVAGRIRDAIRRLAPELPALAAHLDRTVVTGTWCRYRGDGVRWRVELQPETPGAAT